MSYLEYAYPKSVGYPNLFFAEPPVGTGDRFPFWEKFKDIRLKGSKGVILKDSVENGKKYSEIKSTIYLLTDMTIDVSLQNYRDYFEKNIESIWGSQEFSDKKKNKISTKADVQVFLMPTYPIDSTPDNVVNYKSDFVEGEIVLYLQDRLARSFINSNRRTGVMNSNDMGRNTPAHEFGHILGLADRYCYFHFRIEHRITLKEINKYNDFGESEQIQKLQISNLIHRGILNGKSSEEIYGFNVVGDGSSVSIIEPYFAGDLDYGKDCNWKENLMSLGGIQLTNFQLNHVCNMKIEKDYPQYSYFAPLSNKKEPVGIAPSIIGLNNGKIISDTGHLDVCSIEKLISLKQFTFGYHYFNPTIGLNAINVNDYYLEEGRTNEDELEKLEYGGFRRFEIIDKTLGNQELKELNNRIKQSENSGVAPLSKHIKSNKKDVFQDTGKGDSEGREIWSSSWDRIYKHMITFRPNDAPNGRERRVINIELFRIVEFFFYFNRRKILSMYMFSA